eukprot:TCONS_00064848-protein
MNNTQYQIDAGETLNLTLIMSGNPQPNVTFKLEDEQLNVLVTEISKLNRTYKYEVLRVISTGDCGKNLSFTASNEYGTIHQHTVLAVDFDPKATNLTAKLEEECLRVNYTLVDPGLCNVTFTLRLLEDTNTTRAFVVNQDVTQSESMDAPMEKDEEDAEKSLSLNRHSKATPMVQPIEAESISQITSISQTISDKSIQPTSSYGELSTISTTVLQPTTDNTTQQNVLKSFQLSYNTTTYVYCFDNDTILDKFKNSLTISILGQYGNKTSLSATTKAVRILTPAPTTNPNTSPAPNTTTATTTTTTATTRSPNNNTTTTPRPQNTTIQPTTAEKNTTRSPSVTTTKPKDSDEEDTCDDDKKKLVIAMFGGIMGAVAVIALIVIMLSICKDQDKEVEEWDREYLEEQGALPKRKRVHDFTKESFGEGKSSPARRRHSDEKKSKKNHGFEDSCTIETNFGGDFSKTRGGKIKKVEKTGEAAESVGKRPGTKETGTSFNVGDFTVGGKTIPKLITVTEVDSQENLKNVIVMKEKKGGSVSGSATSSNISTIVL